VRAVAWRGAGGGAVGDRQRLFNARDRGRGFRGADRFIFVGLTEGDENSGYFRGPGSWPMKIFHMFVGQEADENNCRIFVGRPTKIFRPTKIYVFPVVNRISPEVGLWVAVALPPRWWFFFLHLRWSFFFLHLK
jgi:hypothetical protein